MWRFMAALCTLDYMPYAETEREHGASVDGGRCPQTNGLTVMASAVRCHLEKVHFCRHQCLVPNFIDSALKKIFF